jgi:nucleoside-diphosphate-sugar epimerase
VRVAVVGATGVIGMSVLPALVEAGHEVVGLTRTPEKAQLLRSVGALPWATSLLDHDGLAAMFDGADAVCNFTTQVPAGRSAVRPAVRPHAWRTNDRLRTEGVRRVVRAAREAGVRRVVQESVSTLYADQGDGWVTEASPLEITRATEPASVGELHVQDYACGSRVGVVLRLATIIGDDPLTRAKVRSAHHGHAIGLGDPGGWAHVVHTDDVGPAVLAALGVPSGIYNVGAEPVRRADLVAGFAVAAGRERVDFIGPVLRRVGGVRLEPLTRSLRVSSEHFGAVAGWSPTRPRFDASWLGPPLPSEALR